MSTAFIAVPGTATQARTAVLAVFGVVATFCMAAKADSIFEPFSADPVAAGRFTVQTAGTESSFQHQTVPGTLRTVLDVDTSTASYLSAPFAIPTSDRDSLSFSFAFRIEEVDDRNTPTAFIGLLTPLHVENFGDGLTVALATSRQSASLGRLVATANIDNAGFKTGGAEIPLDSATDYLAAATYSSLTRKLTVDIYSGTQFTVRIGRSETVLPAGRTLRLTHLGIQNGGARTVDSQTGSLTVTLDDLATPGRPPITLFAEDVEVPEGTDGAVQAAVQVVLSSPADVPVSVQYFTADVTARAGADYQHVADSLVIPAGAGGARLLIPIIPDALAEASEALRVVFLNPVNANLGTPEVLVTLLDDDTPRVAAGAIEVVEGAPGTHVVRVPVRLGNPSTLPVQVDYATEDATAAAGSDYTGTQGTLVFPPETTEREIEVRVLGDLISEGNESFLLRLSSPVNATLASDDSSDGRVTLLDDDPIPIIDVADATVVEGHAGPVSASVPVRLSNASAIPVTVAFSTADDSARAGSDYLARNGVLRFQPGETELPVAITVLGDTTTEGDESFRLILSDPVGGRLATAEARITILDDERTPTLRISDASVVEGAVGGTTTMTLDVDLTPTATLPVTVQFATFAASAGAGVDFVSASSTLTFAPGTSRQSISVTVLGDDDAEPDETFTVRLSNPLNAILDRAEATGTILTDDSVTLSVDDVTVTEGDGVSVQAVFSVSLKGAPVEPVTVGYFTANVTAQAGIDYQAAGAILRFQPGQTLQTVSVPVLGDFIDEPAETFELRLHTPSGATLSRAVGTATVLDNDPPSLIPSPVQVVEGSEGPTNARVVVRLSSPTFEEVQVDFQTVERTATSGTDYVPASGTLVFPAGTSERFIDVSVLGDTVDEADETFAVRLLRPRGALLAATEALVTIRDDDEAPRILIENREVTECSEGNASVIFEVTLSEPSEQVVTVEYSTFDDSAIAGQDYVPVTGTVVFPPGTTVQRVEVPLLCDTTDEPDESFGVGLGQPVNGFVGGDGRGRGRVIDDDPPELSVESVAVHEGDHGLTQAIFRIRLSSASTEVVTVDFSTRDESAFQGTDYAAVSGVVRFAPGSLREEVGVPVIGDSLPEDDETFLVLLANPLNASLAASTAQGIIRDDDQPELRIEDVTAVETDAGTFVARLVLTLTRTSPELVSFAYRTRDETARAGQDYVASNGVVTFPPGESRRELELTGFGDVLIEGPETFTVLFSDPVRALLPDDSAQVTLVDNDGAPVLTVSDVPIDEGQAGPRNLVFAFRLSAPSSVPVSVRYATADATATAGSDYVARSGTVNFAPGITNQTVPVPVLGDAFSESDETFLLVLTDPVQAVLARPQAIGTIRNDDPSPRLTVADEIVEEGPPGRRTQLNFRVQLEPPSSTAVSVRYATLPRTATAGSDFEPSSGVLTFEPGTREKTVAVTVFGDSEIEPGETLVLSLTDPFNAELARTDAVGTILDDDGIGIRIADATTREPDLGSVGLSFVVSLERAATQVITVDYSTRDGTAQAGIDYSGSTTTSTSTLSFPAGLTQQTLTIPVLGDTLDEPDETLQVILSNPVNGVLSRGSATGTILDNDPPSLEVDDVTVVGSQGGAVNATFTVRLSTPSDEQVTVAFATANGTANSGTDYSETSRDLVFSPGQVQRTVDVEVKGNTLDEDTEHFLVNLSNPVNATPGRMQGRGTILNRISVNRPPEVVLTSPADGANLLGPTNLTLTATATDAEGPVARVEFFAGSISLGSDSAAPFAWTWNQAPQGRHVLTARATDSGGLVATSAPVRIVIALPNTPPTIASQPTKTTLEDASSEPIPFTIADTETTSDLLQVSVRSSDPALLPADGLRLTTANGQGTLTVTPAANGFGTATVEFTVRDPGGLVGTHALTVNVLPVNDPPTLALIPDAAVPEDSAPLPLSLTGIGTGAPNEFQALTFVASSSNPSLVPHPQVRHTGSDPTATLSFQPAPGASGTALITVTLRDDGGTANGGLDSVVRQFTVTVHPINDPPAIRWLAPPDRSQFPSGIPITLDVDASDPDDGVASVEFLIGGQVLGRVTRPPYRFDWIDAPPGGHQLVARARDSSGATAETPPLGITIVEPVRDLPTGDILIVRNTPSDEVDTLKRYIDESFLDIPDETGGPPRSPVVVIADRADLRLERIFDYRLIVWDDAGHSGPGFQLQDREIQLLWQAWQFGIPIYFIGEDLGLRQAPLGAEARERWTQLTGLVPGGSTTGPGTVAAEEPRTRSQELFWGSLPETVSVILDDFDYPRPTLAGRLVGDGEVRATISGTPVLTRYPAFNSPFDDDARRLVQSFLVTAGPSVAIEERRILFLNGLRWLLGIECDNFLTEPDCTVFLPENPADPCAPITLFARLGNNGRCQARGVILTAVLPEGFDLVDVASRSIPEGANSAAVFREGRRLVFALGRVEHDTAVEIEARVLAPDSGTFTSQWITRSLYRPTYDCTRTFSITGPACGRPGLEVRRTASGQPEFRVPEPASGPLTAEVSDDLVRWTPVSTVAPGVWTPIPGSAGGPASALRQRFVRIVR